MAVISIKLDKRKANKIGEYPIMFFLSHRGKCTSFSCGISIKEEDFISDRKNYPNKYIKKSAEIPNADELNQGLHDLLLKYDSRLLTLSKSPKIDTLSVVELKQRLLDEEETTQTPESFTAYAEQHITKYTGRSLQSYKELLKRMNDYFQKDEIYLKTLMLVHFVLLMINGVKHLI